jgi:hypothetical protein
LEKGLISRVYRTKKLNTESTNNAVNVMGKFIEQSSQKTYKWPKIHEEMLSILCHKGNANQNYFEISSHASQNDCHPENKQQQMLRRMWEAEGK